MYLLMGQTAKFAVELSTSSGIVPKERSGASCGHPLSICEVIIIFLVLKLNQIDFSIYSFTLTADGISANT